MAMMTPQEMFDTVATHLLTQGVHSREETEDGRTCKYRLGELRCAAGCLITDDEYDPEIEEMGVLMGDSTELTAGELGRIRTLESSLTASGVGEPLWVFLQMLQQVHDAHAVQDWPRELSRAAKLFNVNDRVVTEWGRNR